MHQHQMGGFRKSRVLVLAVVATMVVATSGCHWFGKRGNPYQQEASARPLDCSRLRTARDSPPLGRE